MKRSLPKALFQIAIPTDMLPFTMKVDLSEDRRSSSLTVIKGVILESTSQIGEINVTLMDGANSRLRSIREASPIPVEESRIYENTLFEADGSIRYGQVDGLDDTLNRSTSRGRFLNVARIRLQPAFRSRDIGVQSLFYLLKWLNSDWSPLPDRLFNTEWTFAYVIPQFIRGVQDVSLSMGAEQVIREKIAVQFSRLGFRPVYSKTAVTDPLHGPGGWYLIPDRLCILSKSEVMRTDNNDLPALIPLPQLIAQNAEAYRSRPLAPFKSLLGENIDSKCLRRMHQGILMKVVDLVNDMNDKRPQISDWPEVERA